MAVSQRAVQKHVTAIFEKLDLPAADDDNRRILAVLAYLRAGRAAAGAAVLSRTPRCAKRHPRDACLAPYPRGLSDGTV